MVIEHTRYKDVPAISVKTEKCEAVFLPGEGAKIVSFVTVNDGEQYIYQNPSQSYLHMGLEDSYVDSECSGFDDMFPTIDPIVMSSGARKGMTYRDHGDVCRMPFSCRIMPDKAEFFLENETLGFKYKKTVSESEDGFIAVSYEIENCMDDPFWCLWAGHCMIKTHPKGRVLTPFAIGAKADIMFDTAVQFGVSGERVSVCEKMLTCRDLNEAENSFKYYFTEKAPKGFLGYLRENGKAFMLRYDVKKLPYIGVWINDGAFKNCRCIGLEPCSLAYDTVYSAEKYGQRFVIGGKEKFSFTISMGIEIRKGNNDEGING